MASRLLFRKQSIAFIVALALIFSLYLSILDLSASGIHITIDGQALATDVAPVIAQGRTLVPLRAIFEGLGATVDWDEATQRITGTKDGKMIVLHVGSTTALIEGIPVPLDVPAMIVNGRTMVPGRFIAESLGGTVDWDQPTSTVVIISAAAAQRPPAARLAVHFIDVGQGDSILIRTPDKDVLIDGGERGDTVLNYLRALGVEKLALVIGTHPHSDHIGGLINVLEEIPVCEVMDPGIVHTSKTYGDYLALIDAKDIAFTTARAGMSRDLGNNAALNIYHPVESSGEHLNNASIVAKLVYGDVSFLFTGDAEADAEAQMLRRSDANLKATVLKVGHHGSGSSTSGSFLALADPEAAVIMVGGDNLYGHPHTEVLNKLKDTGIAVYRTDIDGTVVITTDGKTYGVQTHVLPPVGSVSALGPEGKIDINTAALEELQQIVHIGPEYAQAVTDFRPFGSLDELTRVAGIEPARLADIIAEGKVCAGQEGCGT